MVARAVGSIVDVVQQRFDLVSDDTLAGVNPCSLHVGDSMLQDFSGFGG